MKKKALLLAGLGVFALGACVQNQPATNENIADLKAALKKEEAKSDLGYHIGGNVSLSNKVGEHAISEINLKNLDANLSFVGFPTAENNSVRGTDLQAYASFKYTEFSMKAADIDTYDELLYVSTTNGERHDAKFYLDNGDAYLDLSNIGIDSMRVEGENEPVSNPKMRFAGVLADTLIQVNAASSVFDSVPMMMGMSEAEFDNYVLKTALEFRKSGDATEAIANIDAAKLRSIYVSQGLADYYANTLPDIPEEQQNDALVAAKNTLEQGFNAMIPSFDLNLSIKYNTRGLTAISLDTNGKIVLEEEEELAQTIEFDIDLDFKVQEASIPSDFDTSGYTDYEFDFETK
jgi:hypothetical protein